jgi:hypothetical protein
VTGADPEMLLAQAEGSAVIKLMDPLPDKNGVFILWAIDFGPAGIEPAGSSETGKGVLARLTFEAREAGAAAIAIENILVRSDEPAAIQVTTIVSTGEIRIGEACPGEQAAPQATPTGGQAPAAQPTPAPATPAPPAAADPRGAQGQTTPRPAPAGGGGPGGGTPGALIRTGGHPGAAGGQGAWPLAAAGAALAITGAALLGAAGRDKRRARGS